MRIFKNSSTAIAVLAAVAAAGCAGDNPSGPGPTPGTLVLSLTTPNVDDGAVSFRVEGGPVLRLSPMVDQGQSFLFKVTGSTLTGAVLGSGLRGNLIELNVPDIGAASSYRVTLIEVAAESNDLRGSLTAYGLDLQVESQGP